MGNYVKTILAGIGFLATGILAYANDNVISSHEWTLLAAEFAGWLGVYVFPNTKNGENVNALADEALKRRGIRGVDET